MDWKVVDENGVDVLSVPEVRATLVRLVRGKEPVCCDFTRDAEELVRERKALMAKAPELLRVAHQLIAAADVLTGCGIGLTQNLKERRRGFRMLDEAKVRLKRVVWEAEDC